MSYLYITLEKPALCWAYNVMEFNSIMVKYPAEKKGVLLVIDDDESMHDSCSQVLSREGYRILTAFSGEHGMSFVREAKPDIVLLDFKIQGISGKKLIQDISLIDSTIVMIVMTGYATIESAVEAMKLGASDFLPKPFTPDELRIIVKRGMEKRHLLVETNRLQQENARIRENFVSIITHEMRSPLVGVEQYFEVLIGGFTGELQPKQIEILTKCKRKVKWLLSLVNEWLDMARIQDTIILERYEKVNIKNVLDDAADLIQIQAVEKNIEMEFNIPENLPEIMGNHDALVHLFMNLYSNAVKYNNENGRVITKAIDVEDSISVKISDTGIGIPQEFLPFIFDEFFRVRNIREKSFSTKNETGTGLGLSIVKKFVDAHKGYITVESKVNFGTCITVLLPKKQPPLGSDNHLISREN